jgi:flavodoxin I
MKALVVYDSVFGNTEQIAQAIGNAFGSQADVATVQVSSVKPEHLAGLELLVVGSPTRGFRPTEAITNFLKNTSINGIKVAAFDTRFSEDDVESFALRLLIRLGGYAAKRIANRLKKSGGELIAPPEGFFVKDTEGPLKEGELERAADWARQILDSK